MVGQTWLPIFREAAEAAMEATEHLVGTEQADKIVVMKTEGDTTRKIDAVAEEAVTHVLVESGMSFTLISEESGTRNFGKETSETIVLDPIDGSANAIRGIPAYSLSVAAAKGKHLSDVSEALVVDLANHVFYEAELHRGATRNGDSISTSKVERLSDSMIGADLNIVDLRNYMKKIIKILNMAKRKRYLGTNALEVCLVACGKYDAFVDLRGMNRVTDIAAAYLILKEAGGIIVDERGVNVDVELLPTSRLSFVAAANITLCKNILMNLETSSEGV
jgi:myo-inositol-1(or 4)-monophosphatase